MENLTNMCYIVKCSHYLHLQCNWSNCLHTVGVSTDSQIIHLLWWHTSVSPSSMNTFPWQHTPVVLFAYVTTRIQNPQLNSSPVATFSQVTCIELLEAQRTQMSLFFSRGNLQNTLEECDRRLSRRGTCSNFFAYVTIFYWLIANQHFCSFAIMF